MKTIIPVLVAIGAALVVLLSTIIPNPALQSVRITFIDWAVTLAALAALLGLLNLLVVHGRRIDAGRPGGAYSLLTVAAAVLTFAVGAMESFLSGGPVLFEPGSVTNMFFRGVVAPSMAALASLVMFFLVAAAVRMASGSAMRGRLSGWSMLFLGVVLVTLVGAVPLALLGPAGALRDWLIQVPASAGSRGILLGVALGTLVVGLRFLTGGERPYAE